MTPNQQITSIDNQIADLYTRRAALIKMLQEKERRKQEGTHDAH